LTNKATSPSKALMVPPPWQISQPNPSQTFKKRMIETKDSKNFEDFENKWAVLSNKIAQ